MSLEDVSSQPLPCLPPRKVDAHKGDFGRVIGLGGSWGMAGAISITGLSALRSGAGLTTLAIPGSILPTVASFSACYTTIPLVEDREGIIDQANVMDLAEAREKFDAWAVGPGLGRSEGVAELIARLYRAVPRTMVVDADGLNGLADVLRREQGLLANPPGARILTPHPGEYARLADGASIATEDQRVAQAAALCQSDPSGNTIVVLKGHRTVISDGRRVALNVTGNPGMATGGAGDCLTGVVAALAAQGLSAWDASRLGVHVHGLAGDLAAASVGQVSMTATDIVDFLSPAFQQILA